MSSIVWMTHPMHGRMPCYNSLEVDANKKNGWTVEEPKKEDPIPDRAETAHERMAAARAAKAAKRANDE